MSDEGLEVMGSAPNIEKRRCDALLCEQYWHAGTLRDPANVIYLLVDAVWHRLTFDGGIVFWGERADRPTPYAMPELDARAEIDDLGQRLRLAGRRIIAVLTQQVTGGTEVEFRFEGDVRVAFRNVDDRTAVTTSGGSR
jgi:hypothetical protein